MSIFSSVSPLTVLGVTKVNSFVLLLHHPSINKPNYIYFKQKLRNVFFSVGEGGCYNIYIVPNSH